MSSSPLAVVVAGPNGAGKSTIAPRSLQAALEIDEFVNADAIASGLSMFDPQSAAIAAGRAMLERLRWLATARLDFAFETTLASRTLVAWLAALREAGYLVHLMFLSLPNPDFAVQRVAYRVRGGGHDVAESVVRRRFSRGLRNLFGAYRKVADSWQVLDNSDATGPRLIAEGELSRETRISDPAAWRQLKEYCA